ncbi:MAG: DUF5788 family protein, partial [Candidatus Thermoplasmatota archaeon]
AQLRSIFAFTGAIIPDEVVVKNTSIPLNEIVFRLLTKKELSDTDMEAAYEFAKILDEKIKLNKKVLKEYDLTDEEAEKLYFETCGIMKAIICLRDIGKEKSIGEAYREKNIRDAKKILELLRIIKK